MASRRKAEAPALAVPAWAPASVRDYALVLHKGALALGSADGAEIATVVERLATDKRMETVWRYLLKKRRHGGGFLHAGKPTEGLRTMAAEIGIEPDPEVIQGDAMAEVFSAAACAAVASPLLSKGELVDAAQRASGAQTFAIRAFAHMRQDASAEACARALMAGVIDRLGQLPSVWLQAADSDEAPIRRRGDMRIRGFILHMGDAMRTRFSGPENSTVSLCGIVAILANVGLDLRGDKTMIARQMREVLRRN